MALKKIYYSIGSQIMGERPIGGSRTNYAVDALGSVTGTMVGGSLQNTYSYKPFGAQLSNTGLGDDPSFGWAGIQGYLPTGRSHAETYVRGRTYSSSTCRWTSVDPLWPTEKAFGYANCNPTTFVDPTGLLSPARPTNSCPKDTIFKGTCSNYPSRDTTRTTCTMLTFIAPGLPPFLTTPARSACKLACKGLDGSTSTISAPGDCLTCRSKGYYLYGCKTSTLTSSAKDIERINTSLFGYGMITCKCDCVATIKDTTEVCDCCKPKVTKPVPPPAGSPK